MRGRGFHRSGFSLIELLVVIAIMGMLVGLLMPALQQAREAARRTQCVNHLRQLGLALLNFESAQTYFPPGYRSGNYKGRAASVRDPLSGDEAPGWGWAAHLLPFLENAPLSAQINWNEPIWDAAHIPFVKTPINTMLCPSVSGDRDPFWVTDPSGQPLQIGGAPLMVGRSHYVASHGQESCWGDCGAAESALVFTDIYASTTKTVYHYGDVSKIADGPFYRNSRTKVRKISDGLSKTIFLGEHSSQLSDKTWVGVAPGALTLPKLATPVNGDDAAATLVLVHAGPSGGELDILGTPIIHPINFPTLHVGQMYSEHPGGGHVEWGDGSVRFVSELVDLFLWAEMSSMNEGEISRSEL
jgi:prepilin-type N-terminal cleavage/methylation domain-containing protein